MDIPTLTDARRDFHEWLLDDSEDLVSDDNVMMRALGLGTGG